MELVETQVLKKIHGLEFLWIELTQKCNLECVHCYTESSPFLSLEGTLNFEDWEKVLKDGYNNGCRKVQFIGGEPTLYPHLIDLISHAKKLGYSFIELYTNGTNFKHALKNAILKNNVALAFSFYSVDKDIHNSVTLRNTSFAKTVQNISWAVKNSLEVRCSIIDVGCNSKLLEQTVKFIKGLGIDNVSVDINRGIGRGLQLKNVKDPMNELCGNCWKGRLCVTPSGDVYPCVFSRFISVGNISEGIELILKKHTLTSFRTNMKEKMEIGADCKPVCTPQCGPDCGPAVCPPLCSP